MRIEQQGYTIIELTVAMAVAALMITYTLPNFTRKADELLVNQNVKEIDYVVNAAQTFLLDNGTWPDEANNCADTINVLVGDGRLSNIDAVNPFGNAYQFQCTTSPRMFDVINTVDKAELAGTVANYVPATSVAGNQTTTSVPSPSVLPALSNFLARDGSDGGMEADLDMNDNNIVEVNDIFIQSAGKWLTNMVAHNEGVVPHNSIVREADCANGSPRMFGSIVWLSQRNDPEDLEGWRVYSQNLSGNRVRLRVRRQIRADWEYPSSGEAYIHYRATCG